jgi:hypothetical protein
MNISRGEIAYHVVATANTHGSYYLGHFMDM